MTIIIGTAETCQITRLTILMMIKRNLAQLSFKLKFENLNDSNVMGATISKEKIIALAIITQGLSNIGVRKLSVNKIKGSVLV